MSPRSAARRPAQARTAVGSRNTKPRLPVALIFICLVVVYVGIRFHWR